MEGFYSADTLEGGLGNDTFFFAANAGDDVINDFAASAGIEDIIALQGLGFTNFADVTAAATQSGADTVIDLGTDGSITLVGINVASLNQDDFSFA